MAATKIEWADRVWNPITGCSSLSEGCRNCYAKRMAYRLKGRYGYPKDDPFRVTFHPERLSEPLGWKKPSKIFVGSMTDMFHPDIQDEFLDLIMATIVMACRHTFLILTKRPERMLSYFADHNRPYFVQRAMDVMVVDQEMHDIEEEWRSILGYEGLYEVSNFGHVRRSMDSGVAKGRRNKEGILVPRQVRGGYGAVSLSRNGHVEQCKISRLVLAAFVGEVPFLHTESRHKNGKRKDDRIKNLLWGTKEDNMLDAARHGTAGSWMKGRADFNDDEIRRIRERWAHGEKLVALAKDFNSTIKQIWKIVHLKTYKPPEIQWPINNLLLGVSVENQKTADERIPIFLQIPVAKRFLSVEPLLSEIDLHKYLWKFNEDYQPPRFLDEGETYNVKPELLHGEISWVVCGGETGPRARPIHPDWIRSLVEQCQAAGVPFFFKSWGEWEKSGHDSTHLLNADGRFVKRSEAMLRISDTRQDDLVDRGHLGWIRMKKVGKKRSGRLLDGKIWDEMPVCSKDFP